MGDLGLILASAGALLVLLLLLLLALTRMYQRVDRSEALIISSGRGARVSFTGALVVPLLHRDLRGAAEPLPDDPLTTKLALAEEFNTIGVTEVPHKAFIEIQTAWETAVGAALTNATPLADALNEGNTAIQSILDRG